MIILSSLYLYYWADGKLGTMKMESQNKKFLPLLLLLFFENQDLEENLFKIIQSWLQQHDEVVVEHPPFTL